VQCIRANGSQFAGSDPPLQKPPSKDASLAGKEDHKRITPRISLSSLKVRYYPYWLETWKHYDQVWEIRGAAANLTAERVQS